VLTLPALGVPRSFGISLPTVACATAISLIIAEGYRELQISGAKWLNYAFVALTIFGLTIGIGGGIHRSTYVAEALDENSVLRVELDAEFIFNMGDPHVTIPEQRNEAVRDRLRSVGIFNLTDVSRLADDLSQNRGVYERNRQTRAGLFLPKYEYLSY